VASPKILVVGETPSLGRAVADLLEADGIATWYVTELGDIRSEQLREISLVIAAANTADCATRRAQQLGQFGDRKIIIVGSHDPHSVRGPQVYAVGLPLKTDHLLRLVHVLMN
jgi:hypothetical protein